MQPDDGPSLRVTSAAERHRRRRRPAARRCGGCCSIIVVSCDWRQLSSASSRPRPKICGRLEIEGQRIAGGEDRTAARASRAVGCSSSGRRSTAPLA